MPGASQELHPRPMEEEFEPSSSSRDFLPRGRRDRTHGWQVLALMGVWGVVAVVALALLYVWSSGMVGTGKFVFALAPSFTGEGTCGSSETFNISLSPSVTTTTAGFSVKIGLPAGALAPLGWQAHRGNEGDLCNPAPNSTWYGVLWDPSGDAQATYGGWVVGEWTALGPAPLPYTLADGSTFEVIAGQGENLSSTATIEFQASAPGGIGVGETSL